MEEKLREIEGRLERIEQEVFGMTFEEASRIVDNYIEATKENPRIEATASLLKAEKMLGV